MSNFIESISARIEVDDIKHALPLYQRLTGVAEAPVLDFPGLRLAVVGPFLLIEGDDPETLRTFHREATLHVNDLTGAVESFVAEGGEVLDGPVDAAGGRRTIVRDRDGNVFECFQPGK